MRHSCPISHPFNRTVLGLTEAAWHLTESCTLLDIKEDLSQVCSEQFNVLAAIPTTTTSTGITASLLQLPLKPGAT